LKAKSRVRRAAAVSPRAIVETASLDPAKLRVLADPVRSFVLYSLVPRAKTVKELAAELDCPPTRLYYHLQQLEKHGLVFVASTRLVSGIVEKHYRAVARDWVLDRSGLDARGRGGPGRLEALLAFVFDQSRQEIRRQVDQGAIDLERRAPQRGALLAVRNVLKLSDAQADRLYKRLHDFWNEYEAIAKEPADEGKFYAFAVALYPNAGAGLDAARRGGSPRRRSTR
jgi:predicted ArsR family transcriptional regulator